MHRHQAVSQEELIERAAAREQLKQPHNPNMTAAEVRGRLELTIKSMGVNSPEVVE